MLINALRRNLCLGWDKVAGTVTFLMSRCAKTDGALISFRFNDRCNKKTPSHQCLSKYAFYALQQNRLHITALTAFCRDRCSTSAMKWLLLPNIMHVLQNHDGGPHLCDWVVIYFRLFIKCDWHFSRMNVTMTRYDVEGFFWDSETLLACIYQWSTPATSLLRMFKTHELHLKIMQFIQTSSVHTNRLPYPELITLCVLERVEVSLLIKKIKRRSKRHSSFSCKPDH